MTLKYTVINGFDTYTAELPAVIAGAFPRVIKAGVTYIVLDNTQICFANQLVIEAGGVLLISGTGVLTGVI